MTCVMPHPTGDVSLYIVLGLLGAFLAAARYKLRRTISTEICGLFTMVGPPNLPLASPGGKVLPDDSCAVHWVEKLT